jgi:hypothetical protein
VIRAALALAAAAAFSAQAQPQPPCDGARPVPPHAAPGAEPAVLTWRDSAWTPPPCLGWPEARFRLMVAAAGSFRHEGDASALLARFGAISARRGLRYWSVSDKAWQVLIEDTAALAGPEPGRRRADFSPAEMKPGAALFYEERDNRSAGPVTYRMRVLEADAARIVIETQNVSPVRAFLVTLFPPGSLRAAYVLERRDPGTWALYLLSTTGAEASALAASAEASHVNRATALFRHFTGQKP